MDNNPRDCGELGIGLQKIIKRLLANQNLCKLLLYTDKDPLSHPDIEDTKTLYRDLIDIIPRLKPEETAYSYIVPVIVNGITDKNNGEFRNMLIRIYIYIPNLQWPIKNDNLRPFAIIGEIQKSLNKKYISGLGTLMGGDFALNLLTDDMTCYTVDFDLINYD